MPVPQPSLILSTDQYNDGYQFFPDYYLREGTTPFAEKLSVGWEQFVSLANNGSIPQQSLAVRFYHGLDDKNNWQLTCRRCELALPADDAGGTSSVIEQDCFLLLTVTGPIVLTSDDVPAGVTQYFSNVQYKSDPSAQFTPLDPTINVSSILFPWQQLQQLFSDNQTDERPDLSSFTLVINPVVLDYADSTLSLVSYPHSIAASLSYAGTPCLGGNEQQNYLDNAADFGSLCPPNCD